MPALAATVLIPEGLEDKGVFFGYMGAATRVTVVMILLPLLFFITKMGWNIHAQLQKGGSQSAKNTKILKYSRIILFCTGFGCLYLLNDARKTLNDAVFVEQLPCKSSILYIRAGFAMSFLINVLVQRTFKNTEAAKASTGKIATVASTVSASSASVVYKGKSPASEGTDRGIDEV